jgi:hypothetical protein
MLFRPIQVFKKGFDSDFVRLLSPRKISTQDTRRLFLGIYFAIPDLL